MYEALASTAHVVGALSCTPEGWGLDFQSGHIPRLQIWSKFGAHMVGNWSVFLALFPYMCVCVVCVYAHRLYTCIYVCMYTLYISLSLSYCLGPWTIATNIDKIHSYSRKSQTKNKNIDYTVIWECYKWSKIKQNNILPPKRKPQDMGLKRWEPNSSLLKVLREWGKFIWQTNMQNPILSLLFLKWPSFLPLRNLLLTSSLSLSFLLFSSLSAPFRTPLFLCIMYLISLVLLCFYSLANLGPQLLLLHPYGIYQVIFLTQLRSV